MTLYETEMYVPGLQTKHSASHSFLPFRKHGLLPSSCQQIYSFA